MVHAAEVLERLARDVKIVVKNFSLSPTDNLHAILGDEADWNSEPGSLSATARRYPADSRSSASTRPISIFRETLVLRASACCSSFIQSG